MQASMLGKAGALLGDAVRALAKHRPAAESLGHQGAWPTGADLGANAANPAGRRPLPRGSSQNRARRPAGHPFAPFVCRDAYCYIRFDLAANGK